MSIVRRYEGEHAAFRIGLSSHLARQMCCDSLHVVHQQLRLLEDAGVHALQQVAANLSAIIERDAVRMVDVPAAVRSRADERAIDAELPQHRTQGFPMRHGHSVSG